GGPHRFAGGSGHHRGHRAAGHVARGGGGGGHRLAGAAGPQDGHGDQHPQPGLAQLSPARPGGQPGEAALRPGQRRQLRHLRRVVAGRGPRREQPGGAYAGHRHRRRDRARRADLPRLQRRGRGDRAHDHRQQRPQVQVRQLRVSRAVRQRPGHRAARGRGHRGGRRDLAGRHGGWKARRDHRRHGVRGHGAGGSVRGRGDEGHGAVPGGRGGEHHQHPEPRDGGDRGRRDARGRHPVRAAARRGAPPRVPQRAGVLQDRSGGASGHRRRGGRRGGVQAGELRGGV
ncbi:MAG: Sugar kinase and transcription regulator, partial [uncultured Gemmatimonadetes bacterium]